MFGYATYLIARGWFNRRPGQIAIGLVVVVIWGGALLGGLEPRGASPGRATCSARSAEWWRRACWREAMPGGRAAPA